MSSMHFQLPLPCTARPCLQVQAAVDAVLRPVPPGATHNQLRARLRLMAEVYRKTRGLAEDLQVGLAAWPA